jgi:hypothetical protein
MAFPPPRFFPSLLLDDGQLTTTIQQHPNSEFRFADFDMNARG